MAGLSTEEEKNVPSKLGRKEIAECLECTCLNLRMAARVVTQIYDDSMRATGIRVTQFALLVHIYAMGPVALTKLAHAMATDRTTLARNLGPLEKEGLLTIEDGEDRRSRIIGITEEGIRKLTAAYHVWKRTQDDVKKLIGRDVWSEMISNVSKMVETLRGK